MMQPTILKTTLDEKEAARYIGMSRSWLKQSRCLKHRYAPPYILLGYRIRYRLEDLKLWKKQNKDRKAPYWKRKAQVKSQARLVR